MNDSRLHARRDPALAGEPDDVARDLRALQTATDRDLTTLDQSLRAARRRRAPDQREGLVMSMIHVMKARPWLATAVAGAVVALVLLVVPISYERVTGSEVTLTVSGPHLGIDQVRGIAQQLETHLHAGGVMVRAESEGGPTRFVLTSTVPAGSGVNAGAVARAFAGELSKLGYTATASTAPKRERVSGTVYAYARDRVIEINMDGKSAPQLESEIRQRLADAGVVNAQVSVTDLGDGHRNISVNVQNKHEYQGDPSAAPPEHEMPELVLTKNGQPIEGNGFTVRIEKRKHENETTLVIRVGQGDKTGEAQVTNAEAMSDAALSAEIEAQLKKAGLSVTVSASQGKIDVRPIEQK